MSQKGSPTTRRKKSTKKKKIRQDSGNDVDVNRGGGDGGSDGLAKSTIRKKKADQQRKKGDRERRRKKIKESLNLKRVVDKSSGNYSIELNSRGRSLKGDYNNTTGVKVKSSLSKDRGDKILRIKKVELDNSSKLKSTINAFKDTIADDAEFGGGDFRKIQFDLGGVDNLDRLSRGIKQLDNPGSVEFTFNNKENAAQRLEDGFEGIKAFMENAKDKPENDKIKQIEKLVEKLKEDQTNFKGLDKESKQIDTLQRLLSNVKSEITDRKGSEFIRALENSISLELGRQRDNIPLEKERIQEVTLATYENFAGMVAQDSFRELNISPQYLKKVKDLVSDIAAAARLTPDDIGKLFNEYTVLSPLVADPGRILTMGGQIPKLLEEAFSQGNTEADDKSIVENLEADIRDQLAIAINQLGKNIKAEDLPASILTKKHLNKNPPDPIIIPKEGRIDRVVKWVKRDKKKGKRVDGDLKPLNSDTASDVYTVTTQGNIGFSGTNQGYAKIALKKDDPSNKTTKNLYVDSKLDDVADDNITEIPGLLNEDPVLIAREVGSSRIDRGLEIGVLSDQIFSSIREVGEDGVKKTIGISAKVPGKAIREVVKLDGQDDIEALHMFRNFDYTNPNTQKGLADLQIMDAITGQLDRHFSNIIIDPKTGKVYGIDNDMAFPLNTNVFWGENSTIEGLFTGEGKDMKYHQNFIDADTGKKILKMTEAELRKILDGKEGDPEKLSKESKDAAVERFLAVQRRVQDLDNQEPSGLISNWTPEIQRQTIEDGNNLMSRAVQAFEAAGNPDNRKLVQGL